MPSRASRSRCCVLLASRCEFTAVGLIAATAKPNPSGSDEASVGGELAGSLAEGISAGVAPSPAEPGDDDLSSTSMPPLGSVLPPGLPNVVSWGLERSDQQEDGSRPSVGS